MNKNELVDFCLEKAMTDEKNRSKYLEICKILLKDNGCSFGYYNHSPLICDGQINLTQKDKPWNETDVKPYWRSEDLTCSTGGQNTCYKGECTNG